MWIEFETFGAAEYINDSVMVYEKENIRVYKHDMFGSVIFSLIKFEDEKYYIYETDFWTLESAKNELS